MNIPSSGKPRLFPEHPVKIRSSSGNRPVSPDEGRPSRLERWSGRLKNGCRTESCRRKIRWPFRQKDHRIALVVVTEIVYLTVPAALVARAEAGACSKPLRIQVYSMEFSSISVVRPTPADLYQS